MEEMHLSDYNCSALIRKLNAVVAASNDQRVNSEHLLDSTSVRAKIEDINSERYRNMINEFAEKN
jgi:hypothetical protein